MEYMEHELKALSPNEGKLVQRAQITHKIKRWISEEKSRSTKKQISVGQPFWQPTFEPECGQTSAGRPQLSGNPSPPRRSPLPGLRPPGRPPTPAPLPPVEGGHQRED